MSVLVYLTVKHHVVNHFLDGVIFNRSRIRSVGRVLDCRAGGHGFDFRDQTNTYCLKITKNEGTAFAVQTARPSRGSDDRVKGPQLVVKR